MILKQNEFLPIRAETRAERIKPRITQANTTVVIQMVGLTARRPLYRRIRTEKVTNARHWTRHSVHIAVNKVVVLVVLVVVVGQSGRGVLLARGRDGVGGGGGLFVGVLGVLEVAGRVGTGAVAGAALRFVEEALGREGGYL
jgi:hypothetical protein